MKLVFENARELEEGIWLANVPPSEIKEISDRKIQSGKTTLIVVRDAAFNADNKTLGVPIGGIEPLFLGQSSRTILLDQAIEKVALVREAVNASDETPQTAPNGANNFSNFIAACQNEGIPQPLLAAMTKLLSVLNSKFSFELNEGKARKWTAEPNFVAFTIQNRNRQFLVSVKGNHRAMNYTTIKPRAGRGETYSEFHFSGLTQFDDTLNAIENSHAMG